MARKRRVRAVGVLQVDPDAAQLFGRDTVQSRNHQVFATVTVDVGKLRADDTAFGGDLANFKYLVIGE